MSSLFSRKERSYHRIGVTEDTTATSSLGGDDNEDEKEAMILSSSAAAAAATTARTSYHDDANTSTGGSLSKSSETTATTVATTMSRLLELARPERHLMVSAAITMALSSAVSLAVPSYSGKIIDLSLVDAAAAAADTDTDTDTDGDQDSSSSSALHLLLSLLGIMTLAGVAGFFRIYWQSLAGHRLTARLRRNLYAAMLSQDAAFFDASTVSQGDLISRLSSDASLIQSAVTDQALGLLRNIVMAMGAVVMLFTTSISLALVSVAILPPIAICARTMGRRMKERQKRVQELQAAATSLAEQALTCIRTVHQFVAESWESQHYNRAVNQAHGEAIQNVQLKALFGSAMQLVVNLALLCVLGFGGTLVQRRILSPGDLASFVMYSVMMGGNVSGISSQYVDLMKAMAAASRVFEIVDRVPPIPPPDIIVDPAAPENEILVVGSAAGAKDKDQQKAKAKEPKRKNHDKNDSTTGTGVGEGTVKTIQEEEDGDSLEMLELGGGEDDGSFQVPHVVSQDEEEGAVVVPMAVDFENVTFSYPTRPDANILNGLNLSIQAGQAVALVGGSGAGKSTIASLLTRLYDPQFGTIRIDHTSIRDMKPQDVRRQIGIVVQEPLLFPTTIEANIRYGSFHATDEQVREAARLAFVLEFADQFPDGLQTVVGPRGTMLSGGQKQRVAVARCILKNPSIVIFDEATSALDAESEWQVQKAIETACKGRTVIMIAHRLSTIRNADVIAVLRGGRVVEMGSFDSLMNMVVDDSHHDGGAFRQLMDKQLVIQ